MNQQIQNLSKKAWLLAHEANDQAEEDEGQELTETEFNNVFQRKFAELIVQECSRLAAHFSIENKRIHPDIDPQGMPEANRMVYHATCQSIAGEIKEHFGVE